MTIHVTPIPTTIDLAAPAFTLGTANAAGSAVTSIASDSTLLAFDTTVPIAISTGTVSSSVGAATVVARRDHVHGSTAIVPSATEAEVLAATSTTTNVTPGRTQYHPGVAKAWVQFEQTSHGTPAASHNVAGVTDGGAAGNTDIEWSTDFGGGEYAICGITDNTRCINDVTRASGTATVQVIRTTTGAGQDSDNVSIIVFGTQ